MHKNCKNNKQVQCYQDTLKPFNFSLNEIESTWEFKITFLLFSGGYDGYRPPFANTPNSGYGQNQFNTPRDYSNGNYQRVWKVLSAIPPLFLFFSVQQQFVTCFNFLCCTRMVINRTISEELVKDLEGFREAALRWYDPEEAFLMTYKPAPHWKFKKVFAPADLGSFIHS